MGVFQSVIQSILSQSVIGWCVISIIIILLIIGVFKSLGIKSYYKKLYYDFRDGEEKLDSVFQNDELNSMLESFKRSALKGTENINTEVIIEKNLELTIVSGEQWAKTLPSFFIAIGLLGTFLGLTLAIFDTKTALNSIENINNFTIALQNPISSMSSAFWTSIFGVVSSLILNSFNVRVKNEKERFYDNIENYLDNIVFADHANTFNVIFQEFNRTVKLTMLTLTEEMKDLFKNGVEELVSKINSNSIDLTKSAEALQDYTREFENLVKSLDKTIINFNEPVEKFKESIDTFTVISGDLNNRFTESFGAFITKIDRLEDGFIHLNNAIERNKDSIDLIDSTIRDKAESLKECYRAFDDGLQEVRWMNEIQNKEFLSQISQINKGYEKFEEGFDKFKFALDDMEGNLAKGFAGVVQSELNRLSSDFTGELQGAIHGVRNATEDLSSSINIVGQLVRATNEWVAVTTYNVNDNINDIEGVIKYEG